jgi:phytoene dehydrogenase-like protein
MEKSIIIVGAGIAGVSAACYARMNGYKAAVFEKHNIPGGLCTAWTRKGYTWDISMHMLVGSKSGPFHQMWRELGVVQNRTFVYHNALLRVEDGQKAVDFVADKRRLEEQLLAISPGEAGHIREFIQLFNGKSVIGLVSLDAPETSSRLKSLGRLFSLLPLLGTLRKYGKMTLQEFAEKFKDPFLRAAIRFTIDRPGWPMPGYPMMGATGFITAGMTEAGTPIGGSLQVVKDMADRLQRLGGEVQYGCSVKKLIIQNGRVCGVKLEDDTQQRADIVVWAADGHTLLFDMLDPSYVTEELRSRYRDWIPVRSMVHVMLGVARDMSREPARLTFKVEKPIIIAGQEFPWLSFIHHGFDPSSAPHGKTAAEVWYDTDYDYWARLYQDRPAYEAEKRRVANETIMALDKRWPGLAAAVEVVDVPTPATYQRYTGNWRGSPDGWYITPKNMSSPAILKLPALPGLYMAGQWTAPFTGTVMAALSGRQVIQSLCRTDCKPFRTATPPS